MAAYVMKCDEGQFDVPTQTCASATWALESEGMPTLSIADAHTIGLSFALLMATAYVFRRLGKFIDQS